MESPCRRRARIAADRYLRTLVDDLADPHREASTAFEVRRELMDLVARLQQTLEILELGRKADEAGASTRPQIQLEVMPTPEAPIWIFADPVRVEQIVMNLLTYALSTAPEGAHIMLHVSTAQDWAQIEVTPDRQALTAMRRRIQFLSRSGDCS